MAGKAIHIDTIPVDISTSYYAKKFGTTNELNTIHCPDGTLLIDCLISNQASVILCAALNNFVVIRDNMDSSPRWISEMFLREINEVKPPNIEL